MPSERNAWHVVQKRKGEKNMGNNNLKIGMEVACSYPTLQIEFVKGKNEKQAIHTIVNGMDFSTSIIASKDGWHAFFGQFLNQKANAEASMASAKVEQAHTHARTQENTCDNVAQIQNWLDQKATYAKKTAYPFNLALVQILDMAFEDYSIDVSRVVMNDKLIVKNGKACPVATLQQFTKLWLAENKQYEKYKMSIDCIIRKWERIA